MYVYVCVCVCVCVSVCVCVCVCVSVCSSVLFVFVGHNSAICSLNMYMIALFSSTHGRAEHAELSGTFISIRSRQRYI